MVTQTWNAQFELPYSSYSVADIQDYMAYIDWINNRLVFKIKDGCKLALQMPRTIKLFDSTKDK